MLVTVPRMLLSWGLLSALALDPSLRAEGPCSPWAAWHGSSLCNSFSPLSTDFPEEAAAWEAADDQISAWLGPVGSGSRPTGREGGQP